MFIMVAVEILFEPIIMALVNYMLTLIGHLILVLYVVIGVGSQGIKWIIIITRPLIVSSLVAGQVPGIIVAITELI